MSVMIHWIVFSITGYSYSIVLVLVISLSSLFSLCLPTYLLSTTYEIVYLSLLANLYSMFGDAQNIDVSGLSESFIYI